VSDPPSTPSQLRRHPRTTIAPTHLALDLLYLPEELFLLHGSLLVYLLLLSPISYTYPSKILLNLVSANSG